MDLDISVGDIKWIFSRIWTELPGSFSSHELTDDELKKLIFELTQTNGNVNDVDNIEPIVIAC